MFKKDLGIYNVSLDFNNITYSIDKLRLKTYINFNDYSNLDFYLRTYCAEYIKRYYISVNPSTFRYNWNIEIEEGKSFYFGFCHNSEEKIPEREEPKYNLTIEFNPNKLKMDNILMHILNMSGAWYLVRYDLAMDLKVNIRDLILDKTGKRKFHIFGSGADNITYEYGAMGDKHFKVYNKKKESNLNITYDLTRVEITRECNNFFIPDIILFNYDNFFPEIYLNQYVYSLSDIDNREKDKTLYALLFAVQNRLSYKRFN